MDTRARCISTASTLAIAAFLALPSVAGPRGGKDAVSPEGRGPGAVAPRDARPNGPQSSRGPAALDADGDGAVSAAEFAAGDRLFRRLDEDGDGVVLRSEIPESPESDRALQRFDRIDADHDGELTRAEAQSARSKAFERMDGNGDGQLEGDELHPAARDGAHGEERGARLDTDGDKSVSREEFLAAEQRAFRLDTDGDGVITRDEVRVARERLFDRLDANHDGKLTPDERPQHRRKSHAPPPNAK